MTTTYTKPFKTLSEQVALLRKRGMRIADETAAIRQLDTIGYYRLSGYWYIYRIRYRDPVTNSEVVRDEFERDASFDDVVKLYEFDRALRLRVFDAIDRVEVAMRARIGHILGAGHPFAHMDPALFEPAFTNIDDPAHPASRAQWLTSEHAKWLANIAIQIDRSKEDFVKHFADTYGPQLPVWVATEMVTFGGLATLYRGMKPNHRNQIAESFNIFDGDCEGDGATLANWMVHLNHIRNTCGHHARLWNANIKDQLGGLDSVPDLAHASATQCRSRVYASLAVLAYLVTQLDQESTWRLDTAEQMRSMLTSLRQPYERIGCPPNWDQEQLWSSEYTPPADPVTPEHRSILRQFELVSTSTIGNLIDTRTVAERRSSAVRYARSHGRLLAFKVGASYRFPTFQIDYQNRCIDPIAEYANRVLEAHLDPWGAARWWTTPQQSYSDQTPLHLLRAGSLTKDQIDTMLPRNDA